MGSKVEKKGLAYAVSFLALLHLDTKAAKQGCTAFYPLQLDKEARPYLLMNATRRKTKSKPPKPKKLTNATFSIILFQFNERSLFRINLKLYK
jgi:hypothetical protein